MNALGTAADVAETKRNKNMYAYSTVSSDDLRSEYR